MKKIIATVTMGLLVFLSFAKGTSDNAAAKTGENKILTLYSTESDELINLIVPSFQEKTGIKVEIITGGSGEILKRLESEANDPKADVLLGCSYLMAKSKEHLFHPYESPNQKHIIAGFKNDGAINQYKMGTSVILINKNLIGNIKVKGYKDLLNPALKGKIVTADAAASSSAFDHLTNIMADFSPEGKHDSPQAWEYVQKLLENISGNVLQSSSAVHKGVVGGEYAVGLTYEDPACSYVKEGADHIEVVYMEEGVVYCGSALMIVKGTKNLTNAQKFIDYVLSEDIQNKLGTEACLRGVRKDAVVGKHMKPLKEIKLTTTDFQYVSQKKSEWVEKWTDYVTNVK
ncbi:extracellular solute-binding protein [Treponema sp. OMZ 840]|uniref:extracellular solute-binding protein n=1 Tax=Treponema sp. OMZ 840 TaxID=244313 RepID=UPI003D8D53F9